MLLTFSKTADRESLNGQTNLFKIMPTSYAPKLRLTKTEPAPKKQKLLWEKEFVGLYISEHPLAEYADYLNKLTVPLTDLSSQPKRTQIKVGGIVTQIKKIITRSSEPMLFVKIEDASGRSEVLVFPSILKKNPTIWQEEKVLIITGKVSDKDGEYKVLCESVEELDLDNLHNLQKVVQITVPAQLPKDVFERLKNVFQSHPGPYPALLKLYGGTSAKEIKTNFTIDYNDKITKDINELIGPDSISLIDKNL